ncbi:hypothetical protein [Streptomyces amritsarensis]|uniref:hypothetical protein n=2 Tax=Streptomyces TaxID=1883 RepID=UPI0036C22ACB
MATRLPLATKLSARSSGLREARGRRKLDVVFLRNIGPVVVIAQLEAVMTGCSHEEAGE